MIISPFFLKARNARVNLAGKAQIKINVFLKPKHGVLIHFLLDKSCNGKIVNRTLSCLHIGSFEITFTVPLKEP